MTERWRRRSEKDYTETKNFLRRKRRRSRRRSDRAGVRHIRLFRSRRRSDRCQSSTDFSDQRWSLKDLSISKPPSDRRWINHFETSIDEFHLSFSSDSDLKRHVNF
ncbi:hypothetical protein L484_028006 [Morus notabilis]|uniref:Uncharacterized protein n=1 Tax=Morus notabilis TaxID=981085 RepID=W9SW77_9ROSA|nr:hypothetical protein L484_028006 [Morus notabilis]